MSDQPEDKSIQLLGGRVFDIPEEQFNELVTSLEAKRQRSPQRQKTDVVLGYLRPRLTKARLPRRPTPQRVMCMPFEDLLYTPGTRRKALGKIPRHALDPLWDLFAPQAAPDLLKRLRDGLKSSTPDDLDAFEALGAELWPSAAKVFRGRLAVASKTKDGKTQLRDELGGEDVLDSLEEAMLALSIAGPLFKLRRDLPQGPVEDFNRAQITLIAQCLTAAAGMNPAALPHVVYIMMGRLRDPATLLTVFEKLTEEGVGDLLGQVGSQVSEAMVSQTEDRLIDVRDEATKEGAPKADVARNLGRELKTLDRTAVAVAKGGRGMTRRLERAKAEVGRIADQVLVEGSGKATAGLIDGLDTPVGTDAEEFARMREVEGRITALRLAQAYGDDIGLGPKIKSNLAAIQAKLDDRASEMLKGLQHGDPNISTVDLYATVRLIELTSGPEKADQLRLKGLDAMR
jgi:hypothetical protein